MVIQHTYQVQQKAAAHPPGHAHEGAGAAAAAKVVGKPQGPLPMVRAVLCCAAGGRAAEAALVFFKGNAQVLEGDHLGDAGSESLGKGQL